MLKLSQYSLIAGLMLVVLALACYILALTLKKSVRQAPALVHAGVGSRDSVDDDVDTDLDERKTLAPVVTSRPRALAAYGTHFTRLALVFLTACLVFRTIAVGHGPFSNQYEFSVSFGWGMVAAYVYFEHRYHVRTIALLILPLTTGLL